jgi:hypothetical protein
MPAPDRLLPDRSGWLASMPLQQQARRHQLGISMAPGRTCTHLHHHTAASAPSRGTQPHLSMMQYSTLLMAFRLAQATVGWSPCAHRQQRITPISWELPASARGRSLQAWSHQPACSAPPAATAAAVTAAAGLAVQLSAPPCPGAPQRQHLAQPLLLQTPATAPLPRCSTHLHVGDAKRLHLGGRLAGGDRGVAPDGD